jgi:hypothetical protein
MWVTNRPVVSAKTGPTGLAHMSECLHSLAIQNRQTLGQDGPVGVRHVSGCPSIDRPKRYFTQTV